MTLDLSEAGLTARQWKGVQLKVGAIDHLSLLHPSLASRTSYKPQAFPKKGRFFLQTLTQLYVPWLLL